MTTPPGEGPERSASKLLRPGVWRVLGLLVLVLILFAAVFAYEALRARSDLETARTEAHQLQSQLTQGDLTTARSTADRLRLHTARAHSNTAGWLWDVASWTPYFGRDVSAVQTTAAALDTIAQRALPTLIDVANKVDDGTLKPRHGQLPLARIRELTPPIQRAADVVDGPAARLERLDPSSLTSPLGTIVAQVRDRVTTARATLDTVARTFAALPAAAGADGRRDYLLLFQNNAEIRSTGGMAGSWAVLHADHGRVSLGRQGSAADLDRHPPAVAPVPPTVQEAELYGSDLGKQLRDANFNPNFPRFAQMAAGIVGQRTHQKFDGVFALDPVTLSYLLRATGPVQVDGGTSLTAANAPRILLNQAYLDIADPVAQDAFFAEAARKIFTAVVAGQGDQLGVVRGLARGVDERRVLAWSSRPDLAKAIDSTAVAGLLTDPSGPPQIGVFLDDATATKLEYYLRTDSHLTNVSCDGDQVRTTVATTLRSRVPVHKPLPVSVTGPGRFGPLRDMLLNVRFFGPSSGIIQSITVDGKQQTVAGGTAGDRQVAVVPVRLRPGQTLRLRARVSFGPGASNQVQLTTTPGLTSGKDPVSIDGLCS
ncbi:DUF4012 domain-containing protein [Nocardioides terrisoli]|uniref:DUF4012 domain-containing protein n=1 Tax=Nocardioides terrisoli TaxID=3388267 RepID=UPI00287BC0A2|nr:DUF4012 domain-containing protein [Nocardioides marmorisolisilvae]